MDADDAAVAADAPVGIDEGSKTDSTVQPSTDAGGMKGPDCPDAQAPPPTFHCDLLAPAPAGCPAGEACYPHVYPGKNACDPSTFVARCEPEGSGEPGAACTQENSCAGDFLCVGTPYRCGLRCAPDLPCPDGFVCEGVVDYVGVGVCK